jgi:hypothetical protein
MKKQRKLFAFVLALSILLLSCQTISAESITQFQESNSVTLADINRIDSTVVYTSDESISFGVKGKLRAVYPIYTRVQVVQSSSGGLIERSNKLGTFSSISSFALSFIPGIVSMTVSQILSAVSIAVTSSTYVQSKTFTSYVQYQKNGQARWADQSAYSNWVISGKRNHFKHVLGGKLLSNGQWSTSTRDYLDTPAITDNGLYYDDANSWFTTQASQRIQTGQMLVDLPW